ncbi:MAG: glycosyl hydrolase family 18 protein [Rikenellaceae bacterium]
MKSHFVAILLTLSCLICGGEMHAQVVNYALRLSPANQLQSLRSVNIEQGGAYTLQLSLKCEAWQQGGVVFWCGDFKIVQSAAEGIFEIFAPQAARHSLWLGAQCAQWRQLTFVGCDSSLDVWIDGQLHDSYSGDYSWSGESVAKVGGGFDGQIDELRIFSTALRPEDMSHFNTINHYHANWDDVLLYYKFDQAALEDRVVDYRGGNDSYAVGGAVCRVENCDKKCRYMVVSGYSSFIRHNDRPFIDEQMHLMTNDLIMLDAIVDGRSGRIYMQSAENGEVTPGAQYVDELDGRSGVLQLCGEDYLTYNDNCHEDLKYLNNALNFSAWIRLGEWRAGATLFKKWVDRNSEVTISLSTASSRGVKVSVGGREVTFDNIFPSLQKWQHVAVNLTPQGDRTEVSLYRDNSLVASQSIGGVVALSDMEAPTQIGCGVVGALDNIVVVAASRQNFAEYMSGESRDFNFPNGGAAASEVLGAWFFDSEQHVARNGASWQSKIEKIHEIYQGYSGYKIRFGVITHTQDEEGEKLWRKNILCPQWRASLAADVARISEYFDGVDIDFEWLDNNPENEAWDAYGALILSLREAIGPQKVLSASLHPVSYTLPLSERVMQSVDYITVQNYGPRHTYLKMDSYKRFFDDALNYGIPAEKIFLSMATLIVRSDNSGVAVSGYKNLDFEGFTTSTNQARYKGAAYTFNSVDEVKAKMEFLRERGSNGCMYFDMGNDLEVSHPLSLIRALNSVISSNVDKKITN